MALPLSAVAGRCRRVQALLSLAAVLGEVTEQVVHALIGSAIDEVPAGPCLRHQTRVGQFLEMERQRGRRYAEAFCHDPWSQAGWACHDQGAENLEPMRLAKSGKRFDDVVLFHVSSIMETSYSATEDFANDFSRLALGGARRQSERAPRRLPSSRTGRRRRPRCRPSRSCDRILPQAQRAVVCSLGCGKRPRRRLAARLGVAQTLLAGPVELTSWLADAAGGRWVS